MEDGGVYKVQTARYSAQMLCNEPCVPEVCFTRWSRRVSSCFSLPWNWALVFACASFFRKASCRMGSINALTTAMCFIGSDLNISLMGHIHPVRGRSETASCAAAKAAGKRPLIDFPSVLPVLNGDDPRGEGRDECRLFTQDPKRISVPESSVNLAARS